MAGAKEFERLSVPISLGPGLRPSSPSGLPLTVTTVGPGSDADNINGSTRDHLSVLVRSVSHNSHRSTRSSVVSARSNRSVNSIPSHISAFQNVRFNPEPIKDISFWGGLSLLISNMTGPGIVTLPVVAQSSGWLPTILGFCIVGFLSSLSSLFICEAMTEVPGNERFQSNVGLSFHYSHHAYLPSFWRLLSDHKICLPLSIASNH